jgi:hypothetical protein
VGSDPLRLKLKADIEEAWAETKKWFNQQTILKASELYAYVSDKASTYGWEFGGEIAGHLIGEFPHEKLANGNLGLYIHPANDINMFALDSDNQKRHWILELHFIDRKRKIGGFYEQLLT